jgi:probable DNA metabolism protein
VAAAFLSERDGIEYAIAVWLADRFESRVPIPESERDQARYTVEDAARAYGRELHGLKGLLRFRELRDGVLYAPVAPVANVVQGLAAHFRQRLPRDAWVIHDTGRDLALHWDGERLAQADLDPALCRAVRTHGEPPSEYLAAHETRVQTEWRSFFNRIAIPERRNPRLQQQLMPARYWRYLVETPGTPREDP